MLGYCSGFLVVDKFPAMTPADHQMGGVDSYRASLAVPARTLRERLPFRWGRAAMPRAELARFQPFWDKTPYVMETE
jgi:hypothetical protein